MHNPKTKCKFFAEDLVSSESGSDALSAPIGVMERLCIFLEWTSVGPGGSMVEALELSRNIDVRKRRLK